MRIFVITKMVCEGLAKVFGKGFWLSIIIPLVLSPLLIIPDETKKLKCLYLIILMGGYWVTEAIPIPITCLLPIVLLPLMGIMGTSQLAAHYMRDTAIMSFSGLSLGLAIEYSGLHKRVALLMLMRFGIHPTRLLLGIMATSFVLAMVIMGNMAVVAMMIPIVFGIVNCLQQFSQTKVHNVPYLLGLLYGTSMGGTVTIIGSVPNIVLRDVLARYDITQNGKYTGVNFFTWLVFNLPLAMINLALAYGIIWFIWFRKSDQAHNTHPLEEVGSDGDIANGSPPNIHPPSEKLPSEGISKGATELLQQSRKEFGPLTFHEVAVAVVFGITILLWFTKDPEIVPGWEEAIWGKGLSPVGDATVGIAMLTCLFILPKNPDAFSGKANFEPLLSWEVLLQRFPWGLLFIYGASFSLSEAADISGLSTWVGEKLDALECLPTPLLLFIVLLVISFCTEILSNTASITILIPILVSLSFRLGLHPLYLSFAAGMASQYSFILPVSTPMNAFVFSAGGLKVVDMMRVGIPLNFICLTSLFTINITWGQFIFKFSEYEYSNNSTVSDFFLY